MTDRRLVAAPRRRPLRLALGILLVLAVFAVGVALGMALQDSPSPGRTITSEFTVQVPADTSR